MSDHLLVGARVQVVSGIRAGERGVVSRPIDPKRPARFVSLDSGEDLITPVSNLEALQEQTMDSEVERLARESGAEEYVDEERPEVTAKWEPTTQEDLDWMLLRLKEIETEKAEIARLHASAVARLEARRDQLLRKPTHAEAFFRGLIQALAVKLRKELLKSGKAKSRKLMFGTVGWKKAGGHPVKKDEAALLAWARAQPVESEFLKVTEEPNWKLIKAHVEQTGQVVPGVEIETESEAFFAEPVKE